MFYKFTNLNENPWNGTYLLYGNHYYSHWLLTEAIDNQGQLYALIEIFDPSKNGSFGKWLKNTKYPNNFYDAMNENKLACIGKNIKKEYKIFKGWKISKVYK